MQSKQDTIPDMPPPPDPAPAPGTICILGKVLTLQAEDNDSITFKLKVLKILSIGASTPPIAPQDTLLLHTKSFTELVREEAQITTLLKHQQALETDNQENNNKSQWRVLSINHKKDNNES